MRAVQLSGYGGTEVLGVHDVAAPEPGPGRVVVEVRAASINPGEIMIREGVFDPDRTAPFPMGEGSDLAGQVIAVGSDVEGWAVGDEVIGWSGERSSHAELVAVPAEQLTPRPAEVTWEQAGSLYVAGGTAIAMIDAAAPAPGATVVVTAAAGGVGSILVQVLVERGVRVLGVAGPDNADWLRQVGVIPVTHGEGLTERLTEATPDGIAAFLDCFGQGYTDLALELGVPTDKVVTIADFASAQQNGARVVFGHDTTTAVTLAQLADSIAQGSLTIPIAATYPLERVQDAYAALAERRTRGKIVLTP